MTYFPNHETKGLTYEGFMQRVSLMGQILRENYEDIEKYLEMAREIQGWRYFFHPSITITEVDNKNMGHIYLGKIRIPVSMSKRRSPDNKPIPHVITFVVCKYDDYPGEEYKSVRETFAYRIAMEKLWKNYPEKFEKEPQLPENKYIDRFEMVGAFQEKWGLPF